MDFSPWIPVIVTAVLGGIGLALQAVAFAFFMGRFKAEAGFTRELVGTLLKRDDDQRASAEDRAEARGQLIARLEEVERNTNGVQNLQIRVGQIDERLAGMRRDAEAFTGATSRQLDSVQRQLTALVSGSGGAVIRIEKQGGGSGSGL